MPGLSTNSTMGSASVPANGSNNLSSEYIYDQGLSCPFTDGYAYYTGFEPQPPVEWNEHINYFWVDDQNSQLSNENLPYVYCTPGYGFSYSSQDQYSYMPGMFMGVDGSFVGSQQYFAGPYQPSGSPSGYFPLLIQPTTGLSSTVALDPPVFSSGTSVASRPVNTSVQNQHKISGNTTHTSQTVPSGSPAIGASQHAYQHQSTNKSSDLPGANVTRRDKPSTSGSPVVGPSQHAYQNQSTNKPSDLPGANVARHDKPSTSHLTFPIDASSTGKNFQVTSGAWSSEDRGPRTDKPELASHATVAGEDGQTRAVSSSTIKNIVIHPEQYNKEDFPFDHPDAKLFVIKSYSEDDVHKSIKYNVWSSTPNGNRRLDAAYSDAQGRIPRECPIFLFFSVNTSGQFCGVAEMIGPVDFGKDMNFWQQDKWSGSFPVKWHLIKDVPNSTFRHIILENNENKPVTNSRDTQEIPYKSGINMLKLFKSSPMTTSILDDFPFYEGRQKAMVEQKRRHLGRSSDGLIYVPAFVAKSTFGVVVEPSKVVKGQFSGKGPHSGKTGGDSNVCEQPDKMNEVKDGMTTQVLKEDEVTLVDQPEHVKTDQDSSNARVDQQIENCSSSVSPENVGSKPACSSELVKVNGKGHTGSKAQPGINSSEPNSSSGRMDLPQEFGSHVPLDDLKSAAPGIVEGIESIQILKKPEKLSTNQVVRQAKGTVNEMEGITPTAVVKVGSMKIKVNMANLAGKLSSEIIGDEMCSVEPKGAEHVVQAISSKMS